jgi:hypothetical protein
MFLDLLEEVLEETNLIEAEELHLKLEEVEVPLFLLKGLSFLCSKK